MKRILDLPVISAISNSVAVFLLLSFVGLGCSLAKSVDDNANSNSGTTNAANADETRPEAASGKSSVDQQIRKIDFKNFTYQPSCTYEDKKSITVKNGEFSSEKQEVGYVDRFYFNVTSDTYGDLNVDHRLTFQAVLTATRPLPGAGVKDLYAFEVPSATEWAFQRLEPAFRPSVFEDVSDTIEVKLACMARYTGEARAFPHPRSAEALRATARRWGAVAGMAYAEAFELIRSLRT